MWGNTVIDLFFLADIFVSFRTTYYDLGTGEEIFDARLTAREYLANRFWIDLISTIPVENIAALFTHTKNASL